MRLAQTAIRGYFKKDNNCALTLSTKRYFDRMKKIWINLLPAITILFAGCGNDNDANKLETPHELNRLTVGVFRAAKVNNYVSSARQIEKLKTHYPHNIKLSKLHRVEMDNITIVRTQRHLGKGNIKEAQQQIALAIRQRGESLSLDAANKELLTLMKLSDAVSAAVGARSAGDLKFQLDLIDNLVKKYPKGAPLAAGLAQNRRRQKDMDRQEKQMALIDLLSDIELAPTTKRPILKAQFEYENQHSPISISDKILK